MVPTGNDSATVQKYYATLYNFYLDSIHQRYAVDWMTVFWIVFWVVLIAGALYAWTRWDWGDKPSKLYPVESYNGYISESNGKVGRFLIIIFTLIGIWALVYTVMDLTRGQIY